MTRAIASRSRTRAPAPSVAAGRTGPGRTERRRQVDQASDLESDGLVQRGEAGRPARQCEASPDQFGDRPVGDGRLARIRPGAQDDPAVGADGRRHGLREPRLADPRLALEEDHAAIRTGGPPGRRDDGELAVAPDHRHRSARSAVALDPGPATDVGLAAPAPAEPPSRIASYRSVVSRSGATPSSRSNRATSSRYWWIAAPRSPGLGEEPDEPPLADLVERIELDPAAGDLDGALGIAGRRAARPPAAASRVATVRSTRVARAACQSSKAGLSRSAKPARNGPRARAAAASRSAGREDAASRSTSARSTDDAAGSSATCARPITRPASPTAVRSDDSVRRRAPRAASSSASGQNIAASSSRANGRPSAATSATMASALRVSTTIGRPATATSSGPRSRIASGVARRGIA